ncbi:MAG TPA: hypothetical protein PLP34_01950 [Chitinophagaceae bacterium]|nr:hypothetical protein [Chitinophagaceae bacterium]
MKSTLTVSRKAQGLRERLTVYLLHRAILAHSLFHKNRKPWGLQTRDLLCYPSNSLGRALGEFLLQEQLEPIPKLERHDVFHVLLDYDTGMRDEAGLYFFLFGNGKKSLFSIGTILFAAMMFPEHWFYMYRQYKRGQQAFPILKLKFKHFLRYEASDLKNLIFRREVKNKQLLQEVCHQL